MQLIVSHIFLVQETHFLLKVQENIYVKPSNEVFNINLPQVLKPQYMLSASLWGSTFFTMIWSKVKREAGWKLDLLFKFSC